MNKVVTTLPCKKCYNKRGEQTFCESILGSIIVAWQQYSCLATFQGDISGRHATFKGVKEIITLIIVPNFFEFGVLFRIFLFIHLYHPVPCFNKFASFFTQNLK